MDVSIELFIADNLMMNCLILRLAATLLGRRVRGGRLVAAAAAGTLYALLATALWPWLMNAPFKLLLGAVMALPMKTQWKRFICPVLAVYLSAFLMGGLMLALTQLFGGGLEGGVLQGNMTLRLCLTGMCLCAAMPRLARFFLTLARMRNKRVRLYITMDDRVLELDALVDSGNLVAEPLTGLPVVLVQKGLLKSGGIPVPVVTPCGGGIVYARRPAAMRIRGAEEDIDALVAEAPEPIEGFDAIIGSGVITETEEVEDVQKATNGIGKALSAACGRTVAQLRAFRRNAARAVSRGGGAGVDSQAVGGRGGGPNGAH